jgi:hypothetical protein
MEFASKLLVHPEIGGGVAFRKFGEVEAIMTNRPKRLVGEAAIILFDIAARKVAYRIGERSNCIGAAGSLSSLVLPDQPNQRPPRGLSAACSATASPPAAGATEDDGNGTRFETTTRGA